MKIIETLVKRMDLKTLKTYADGDSRWGEAARAEMARRRKVGGMSAALAAASSSELQRIARVRLPGDPFREEAIRILDVRRAETPLLDGEGI